MLTCSEIATHLMASLSANPHWPGVDWSEWKLNTITPVGPDGLGAVILFLIK